MDAFAFDSTAASLAASTVGSALSAPAAVSVAGLTAYLQTLVEEDGTLRQIWLVGEVSNARDHPSGLFFTLQDLAGSETLQCVVWRSYLQRLSCRPQVGMRVLALGTVRLYPQRSTYQLMVYQVLADGAGLAALQLQQLHQRLRAEGLFAADQKRPLPTYPETVAVVTSPEAAAWGDIQRTLRERHPGLQVLLSPATVQGALAPGSLLRAVERVIQDGRAELMIVARGGGSAEDLAAFNDEALVRTLATCSLPVVTGIGHQRDQSLCDLVADVGAATPTAAAAAAVPAVAELRQEVCDRKSHLAYLIHTHLASAQQQLAARRQGLQRLRLDQQLIQHQQRRAHQQQRLIRLLQQQLHQRTQHCRALGDQLHSLDPNAVLQRGYGLIRHQRQLVTRAAELQVGQTVDVTLAEGSFTATVQSIHPSPADQ